MLWLSNLISLMAAPHHFPSGLIVIEKARVPII